MILATATLEEADAGPSRSALRGPVRTMTENRSRLTAQASALAAGAAALGILAAGCADKIRAPSAPEPQEFVATLGDFAGYKSWRAVDYTIGPVNPVLMGAHMADDLAYSRRTHISSAPVASGSSREGRRRPPTTRVRGTRDKKEVVP